MGLEIGNRNVNHFSLLNISYFINQIIDYRLQEGHHQENVSWITLCTVCQ